MNETCRNLIPSLSRYCNSDSQIHPLQVLSESEDDCVEEVMEHLFAEGDSNIPTPHSEVEIIQKAQQFRSIMEDHQRTHVCAVCALYHSPCNLSDFEVETIPNLDLLRTDIPSTPSHPRSAKTVWINPNTNISYCLEEGRPPKHSSAQRPGPEEAMFSDPRQEGISVAVARLCKACHSCLKRGVVPNHSLVCVDASHVPVHLPPLNMVEQSLVSISRGMRYIAICRQMK